MTQIAILPVPTATGVSYRGIAGEARSQGRTAGEALDALTAQLPDGDAGLLVVVQRLRPDRYFSAIQQQRLGELMARWRGANDAGHLLPPDEQTELDDLIEEELRASTSRAAALADEAGR
jgi:hypothetical protein